MQTNETGPLFHIKNKNQLKMMKLTVSPKTVTLLEEKKEKP